MKRRPIKRILSLALSCTLLGSVFSTFPALKASALTFPDSTAGLSYDYVVTDTAHNYCKLTKIYNTNDSTSKRLTTVDNLNIPNKIKGYTVTELGDGNNSIIYNPTGSKKMLNSVTIPNTVTKINALALINYNIPALQKLKIDLTKLQDCHVDAFGYGCTIKEVYIYDKNRGTYINANTIQSFEKYFGLVYQYGDDGNVKMQNGKKLYTQYKFIGGDCDPFRITDSKLNGKLRFLNAMSDAPYCRLLGYEYAKNNGFTATNISKQDKLDMIFNYLMSHARYSRFQDTTGAPMHRLAGSSLSALAMNGGVCGALAHGFETLCRASGFYICDTDPSKSEVTVIRLPGHAANAVRLSSSEKFYIIDCANRAWKPEHVPFFMLTNNYPFRQFSTMYNYSLSISRDEIDTIGKKAKFSASMLSNNTFAPGNSYVRVDNKNTVGVPIEIYDKNKPSCKFINFTTHKEPAVNEICNITQFCRSPLTPQYVSSYCYLGMKVGGTVLYTPTQIVTFNGKKYKVIFETRSYKAEGQAPANSYSDYFYLSIEPA